MVVEKGRVPMGEAETDLHFVSIQRFMLSSAHR
jgi:hypothetical protein